MNSSHHGLFMYLLSIVFCIFLFGDTILSTIYDELSLRFESIALISFREINLQAIRNHEIVYHIHG